MPFSGVYYPPTSPGEIQPFSIDFGSQLAVGETLVGTPVAQLVVINGVDASPGSSVIGAAVINGTLVSQNIGGVAPGGLQPEVVYNLILTATTSSGKTLVNNAHIPCADIE